jgi:hypothetical protein
MKASSFVIALLALGVFGLQAEPLSTSATMPPPTSPQVASQDANSRVWQWQTYEAGLNGKIIPHIHSYTELATGLNHRVNGQWVEAKEEIDLQPDGSAAATNGQHQVYFPSDIYNGQIELVTPDGKHLKSRPVGLSYDDGTHTVLLAALTNSIGQLVGANQVLYTNAFTGFDADLLYTYQRSGFEQDVILREQPPAPEDFNLDSANTRLQMLTEFFEAPSPAVAEEPSGDERLDFGAMQMVQGKAFLLGRMRMKAGRR